MRSLRFKILVRTHQEWILTYAHYFLGNRSDAEVLLRIWQHLDELKWDAARPWIIKTTRNLCLDVIRKRKHRRTLSVEDAAAMDQATSDPEHDPMRMAQQGLLQKQLSDALLLLPETQRSALILRDIQDLSYRQISAALDIPLNTVKVYILRGRQALRRILSPEFKREIQDV